MTSFLSRLLLIALAFAGGLRAQDFNLNRDFPVNNNPGGVWSFGWQETLGTGFELVTYSSVGYGNNGVPYNHWLIEQGRPPFFASFPFSNTGTATSDDPYGFYPPGTVVYYAGFDGDPYNYAVIRFTAPSNGVYHVGAAVKPYLLPPASGDTDWHVLSNGVSLLSQFLAGDSPGTSFSNVLALAAGDTLDFTIGRGADGRHGASGLKIGVTITPQGGSGALPFVSQHPASITTRPGSRVAFDVVASSSTPVSYQWYFEGELLAGKTASTLKVKPVRPRDAGAYSVRVATSAGAVWASAVLTVERGNPLKRP